MTKDEKEAAAAKAQTDKEEAETKAADDATTDTDKDSEEEGTDKGTENKNEELDLDDEIKKEEGRKADPEKAKDAFKERKEKRAAKEGDENEDDSSQEPDEKPVTQKDLIAMEERAYKRMQRDSALGIAKSLAASDKEGQLIFLKWNNRAWPQNMPLQEQLEEAYAITHRKKFIGERNEALRVARNRANSNKDAAGTHRDAAAAGEPKMSDGDRSAILAAGFVWDGTKRLYKKALGGGKSHIYRDPKTNRTYRAA